MARPPQSGNPWRGFSTAWAVTGTMVAGILVWGGIGFLLDTLIWARLVFTGIGVVIGAAAGTYIVYLRYGKGKF
jgi:F0F1-type ATP synthase assembly protein I